MKIENQMIDKLGICVRVMGDLSLVPEKLRNVMERAMKYSENNTRYAHSLCPRSF